MQLALRWALLSLLVGCGAPPAKPTSPRTEASPAPATEFERYFPAPNDSVYAYDTVDEQSGERGVLMVQISRPRPGRVDLRTGARTQRLAVSPQGIEYLEGGFLLKPPLTTGAAFPGRAGQTTVVETDVVARVAAGTFADCIRTREEAIAPGGSRTVVSTFCRDVGLVTLTVEAATDQGLVSQSAVLRSFGPRVDIGAPAPAK